MLNAHLENTLVYDPETCNGCGMCVNVCPHAVFEMEGRKAKLIRPQACMECGACQLNCVTNAISVESGVGCAAAMINAALRGREEATCEC
jgi:NAD-dependent dihydropyrimidine dehydrogenase PreA subunit